MRGVHAHVQPENYRSHILIILGPCRVAWPGPQTQDLLGLAS